MTGIIYEYINNVTGKVYVGQTVDPKGRKRSHRYNTNFDDTYFYRALRKYGENSFTYNVIEECSQSTLNDREIYWINQRGSIAPNGYNTKQGGSQALHSEESKAKMSEARMGIKFSESHLENLRKSHIGNTHTEETKEKLRNLHLGRKWDPSSHIKRAETLRENQLLIMKPIERYNDRGEVVRSYPSVRAAADELGVISARVVECCQGKRRLKKVLGRDRLRYVTTD